MKIIPAAVRFILLFVLGVAVLPSQAQSQSGQPSGSNGEKTGRQKLRFPAAKRQTTGSAEASEPSIEVEAEANNAGKIKIDKVDKDSAEEIRNRERWFYKPRASANGHIPAGARTEALKHMQHMMEAEGKLVRQASGAVRELVPLGASVTNTWSPIGPTPTTGGFFSPVTGRITTIAIDPSDASGGTVLIGGAQGGIWRTTNAGTNWTPVGDQNLSLAMGSIAFAPSSPATVYAGTGEQASIGFDVYYGAGVLKSGDGGLTWAPSCSTPSATCPFIGPFSDVSPFGFFTLGGARISYVAVNPTNPQMVLVAAQFSLSGSKEGVYCSADGGTTWNIVPSASGQMATFVGFASPTVAFAALGNPFGSGAGQANNNGIYQSSNAGSCALTFAPSGTGLPASNTMGRIDLGISPLFSTDKTVYASIASSATFSNTNLGVWVTTNGGTSWTQKTAAPDICQQQCWYDNVIKVDPNGGSHAFFGGAAVTSAGTPAWVVRTADGGTSWQSVIPSVQGAGLPHVDNHAMAFLKLAGGKIRMYLGNDGGIWRSDDAEAAGVVWTNLNDSLLTLTQFYPALSVHTSNPGIAFAGAQDNGSQIFDQPVNASVWSDNGVCGDGTGTAIDKLITSTVYVACNGLNILASVQNGLANTYVPAVNGINGADNSNFVPPLTTDPGTANRVYAGSTKVYQSANNGTTWTALSGDLVNGANGDSIISLAVAPKNPSVVYAGADTGQVFVATNVAAGSGSFNQVTGQASLPGRQVNAIAVDPGDVAGLTAYAAFSGFSFVGGTINDPKGHLFKTVDGGATWTDASCTVANCVTPGASDLPNTPVNDVVIDPDIAGTLYVATDIGVYLGTCTTTCSWSTLSTGLPRVAVLSLKLHEPSRTLLAATHGRGAWNIILNNFTFPGPHISSISPVSAAAGSSQFVLTVNGNGLAGGSVQWNGATTGVTQGGGSDTALTATIAAALIGGSGTPQVTVAVGASTSNALPFSVLGGAPTITSVSPASAPVNSPDTPIIVVGTGFTNSSKVLMNPDVGGTAIPTTFTDATHLSATVPAAFMAGFGSTNSVGVQNPPPGGGTTVTTQTVTLPVFTVVAAPPANDNFAAAANITSTAFTDTKDSSAATVETSDPTPACAQGFGRSNTIWYKVTPTATGTANIDTIGSSYDSVLSVWTGSGSTEASQTATAVACNDDINPGIVTVSQLTGITLTAGNTYFIMVSSFGPADPNPIAFGGKTVLNFTFTGTIASGTGSFTISGTAATSTAGGTQGTSTIQVTPAGGFTGSMAITCLPANLPPGVTCTPNPLNINVPNANTATGTLTLNVAANSSTLSASALPVLELKADPQGQPRRAWIGIGTGSGLLAFGLLLLPGRKRYRAALGLGLVCLISLAIGCGGGGGNNGPFPSTTQLTVTSSKVAQNAPLSATVNVTSSGGGTATLPTGTITFVVDGAALATTAPLSSGTTGQISVSATATVGTHTILAKYSGDAAHSASQSGTLNITVTGTTTVTISSNPASSNGNQTVSLTIN